MINEPFYSRSLYGKLYHERLLVLSYWRVRNFFEGINKNLVYSLGKSSNKKGITMVKKTETNQNLQQYGNKISTAQQQHENKTQTQCNMIVVSAPLKTCIWRWIPPSLYYMLLKFMLGLVRTIFPSRFQFKLKRRSLHCNALGSQELSKGVCPP